MYSPPVLAHDNRLQQVFVNLFNNARDAIREQAEDTPGNLRTIRVRTFAQGDRVVAEVADTGGGVDDAVRNKIFEPFFTTKGVGKGTGLGLAITFGIVRDYGGNISIGNEDGWGAVFRLDFPVSA